MHYSTEEEEEVGVFRSVSLSLPLLIATEEGDSCPFYAGVEDEFMAVVVLQRRFFLPFGT